MPMPQSIADFDIAGSTISVWLFRKRPTAGGVPQFTGRWVEVGDALANVLKQTAVDRREEIIEVNEYGLLAENLEGGALHIHADETNAALITDQCDAENPARLIENERELNNTVF